jgi:MFS family permease
MKSLRTVDCGEIYFVFTVGNILRQLSLFITFPYFSVYIQALGGGAIEIGVVNSLLFVAPVFIYPIAGFFADRYNRVKHSSASKLG